MDTAKQLAQTRWTKHALTQRFAPSPSLVTVSFQTPTIALWETPLRRLVATREAKVGTQTLATFASTMSFAAQTTCSGTLANLRINDNGHSCNDIGDGGRMGNKAMTTTIVSSPAIIGQSTAKRPSSKSLAAKSPSAATVPITRYCDDGDQPVVAALLIAPVDGTRRSRLLRFRPSCDSSQNAQTLAALKYLFGVVFKQSLGP